MGAYLSKGGKSFICMSSTFNRQGRHREVPDPSHSGKRLHCHRSPAPAPTMIVTEYGMVNLKGMSTWERAEALIGIAHPEFRDELIKSAEAMHIWRKSNKR